MNYRVIWLSDLEDVLISLYLRASADGQAAAAECKSMAGSLPTQPRGGGAGGSADARIG